MTSPYSCLYLVTPIFWWQLWHGMQLIISSCPLKCQFLVTGFNNSEPYNTCIHAYVCQFNYMVMHLLKLQLIVTHILQHREMEDYVIRTIVVGVVSWTSAFVLVRRIFPKRSFDFCNRVVSTLHATLAVALAWLSVEDWKCPICPVGSKSSPKQVLD